MDEVAWRVDGNVESSLCSRIYFACACTPLASTAFLGFVEDLNYIAWLHLRASQPLFIPHLINAYSLETFAFSRAILDSLVCDGDGLMFYFAGYYVGFCTQHSEPSRGW